MAVVDSRTIDFIGIDENSGDCVLTVSDHLEWDGEEHLIVLQDKLNSYLAFMESGELEAEYPDSEGRQIRIDVVVRHQPDEKGLKFFESAGAAIKDAGFSLRWSLLTPPVPSS